MTNSKFLEIRIRQRILSCTTALLCSLITWPTFAQCPHQNISQNINQNNIENISQEIRRVKSHLEDTNIKFPFETPPPTPYELKKVQFRDFPDAIQYAGEHYKESRSDYLQGTWAGPSHAEFYDDQFILEKSGMPIAYVIAVIDISDDAMWDIQTTLFFMGLGGNGHGKLSFRTF